MRIVFCIFVVLLVLATGNGLNTYIPSHLSARLSSSSLSRRPILPIYTPLASVSPTISDTNSATRSTEESNRAKGLACVLGGAMVHLVIGTIYCWGNFISYAPESLRFFDGKSHPGVPPDALYAIPINFAIQSLVMPFSPAFVKALGASRALLVGSAIIVSSIFLASFQKTLASFLSFYSVLFGIGIGLSYTIPMGAGWKWLPQSKGLVSGGVLTGLGAGGFIFSLIGSRLANPQGLNMINGRFPDSVYSAFPSMLRKLAAIYAILALCGSLLVSEPPVVSQSPPASTHAPAATASSSPPSPSRATASAAPTLPGPSPTGGLSVQEALSSFQFWLMWTMIIFSGTAGLNTVAVYKQFAATSPMLTKDSYLALVGGIAALFNGSGRLLWGYLSDKIGFKRAYKLVTLLQAMILITYPRSVHSPVSLFSSLPPISLL